MSSEIPRADLCLLRRARDDIESNLVESVKQKTLEDIRSNPTRRLMNLRIKARAYRIAKEVFDDYESYVAKILPNPLDREYLVATVNTGKVVGRLIDVSISVFKELLSNSKS